MAHYLAGRIAAMLVTLWLVATAGFLLVELIPGDPARSLAGPSASVDSIERIRRAYGFDEPFPQRYVESMARMVTGDLGFSFSRSEEVTSVLLRSAPGTILLTSLAFGVEVVVGVGLALWVVARRRKLADRLLLSAAAATSAFPAFLVGLLFIYLFAFRLGWFPLGGRGSPAAYVLPVASLGVPFGLVLARLLRTTLLDELRQPYIVFASALGDPPGSVRLRHALPNALLPLLSVLSLDFAGLFSSVAVVEVAFSMGGLGSDLYTGLRRLDTALIVGVGMVAGLVVAIVNLAADLAVIVIDPRSRR